jgi:hypothetical protein
VTATLHTHVHTLAAPLARTRADTLVARQSSGLLEA